MTAGARGLLALVLAGLAAGGAYALDGLAPLGRVALRAGLPALAAPLLQDPLWKGVALYRRGDYEAAVAALREAGRAGYFDRGNALARAGRYPEAVAVYDAALYEKPLDGDARANRALVLSMIAFVGEAQAAPGHSEADGAAPDAKPRYHQETYYQPILTDQSQGRKSFDERLVAADRDWLATLPDQPGSYLKRRLAAERDIRLEAGTGMPPAEDPR